MSTDLYCQKLQVGLLLMMVLPTMRELTMAAPPLETTKGEMPEPYPSPPLAVEYWTVLFVSTPEKSVQNRYPYCRKRTWRRSERGIRIGLCRGCAGGRKENRLKLTG